jgi:hypothetical protein
LINLIKWKEDDRDETRRDETRRDETRRDETRRDETRRDDIDSLHQIVTDDIQHGEDIGALKAENTLL